MGRKSSKEDNSSRKSPRSNDEHGQGKHLSRIQRLQSFENDNALGSSHRGILSLYGVHWEDQEPMDPTIDIHYIAGLQNFWLDPNMAAFNDVVSPRIFDNVFYQNILKGLGFLAFDQILYTDAQIICLVETYTSNQNYFF